MRFNSRIIIASLAVASCCAIVARGQNRDKVSDAANAKRLPAATGAAAQTQKPTGSAKKPGEPAKPAATETGAAAAPAESADEKALRASAETFTKLYNAHDSKGLAALFAQKAEMIDEDDNVVKGREAIEQEFGKVFQANPKASMQVDIESIRVLTSQLAIEEGTARSQDSPEAPEDITTYVAIHVKTDGKWLLACVRDWDAPAAELTPHDRLDRELSWLLGEWIDESPDSTVHTVCKWRDNGNFLMQEFQVHVGGEIAMSGTMRIGWNALTRQFQSWIFDSHGGHSTGLWSRDGDRWIAKMQGATATGEAGSSTNYYRPVGNDTIAWGSYDRVVDGERLDDIGEFVVKRRPPPPSE
jgi:uncharacterized protein (TIGR02246 family)